MTDKEKLIDLLTDNLDGCDNPLQRCSDEQVERLAEYLLGEGVSLSPIATAEQWLDDIGNPLESKKIAAALLSEINKFSFRKENKAEDISPLDITIIQCLKYCLELSNKGHFNHTETTKYEFNGVASYCRHCESGKPTKSFDHKLNSREIRYCYYCGRKVEE